MPKLLSLQTYRGSTIEIESSRLALASPSLSQEERTAEINKNILKIYEEAAQHVRGSSMETAEYKRCYHFIVMIDNKKVDGSFYPSTRTGLAGRLQWNQECFSLTKEGARLIENILLRNTDNSSALPELFDGDRFEVFDLREESSRWNKECPKIKAYYHKIVHPFRMAYLDQLVSPGCHIIELGSQNDKLVKEINTAYRKYSPSYIQVQEKNLNGQEKADIVIGMGVVEAMRSRQAALRVLEKLTSSLKQGGYLIFTSYKPSLVQAKDFTGLGLTVKNMQIPHYQLPFYVAQK